MSSGSFEAKNYMYRKNKDGIIVGLVVHPNDVDADFAALPIGARVMIAWAAIGDDEKPVETQSQRGTTLDQAFVEPAAKGGRGDSRERPAQPKKAFSDYPLSAQCAMTCEDTEFIRYLTETRPHAMQTNGYSAAIFVRNYCCVTSRKELSTNAAAAVKWHNLNAEFESWKIDQRYPAGARR